MPLWEEILFQKELDKGKIRDTKGKFHAKMGLIKDRNGMKNKILQKRKTSKKKPMVTHKITCSYS